MSAPEGVDLPLDGSGVNERASILMRWIDAYAADYSVEGKLATTRASVERAVRALRLMDVQTITVPQIGNFHQQINAVGSRVICDPPPVGTDQDWLVLVPFDKFDQFIAALAADGWKVGGSEIPAWGNYRFRSLTKGEDNVIATASEEFHRRFLAATAAAKALNLVKKQDRINLFQAVLYSSICDPQFEVVNSKAIGK